MIRHAYRLVPREGGGFHFGREGRELEASAESLPSDSLTAALIAVYAATYGDPANFIQPWLKRQPPFVLSSVFPYVGDIPLLPMPRLRVEFRSDGDPGIRKRLKGLRYVSPLILTALLTGQHMDEHWTPTGPRFGLQGGAVWLHPDERALLPEEWQQMPESLLSEKNIWKNSIVPRVTVDRASNSSTIYQAGRTVFASGCGLWFLADIRDQRELLDDLLMELSLRGIGGERSAGYGAFNVGNPLPLPDLPLPNDAKRVMTLSRYHPHRDELAAGVLGKTAAYELVRVGGWLASPYGPAQRRRQVRMIEAGSVLEKLENKGVIGQLVDVAPAYDQPGAPSHPVYRSGFALPVGVTAPVEVTAP